MDAESRSRPIVVVRDDVSRTSLHGDKAAEMVNGLVSNEVAALAPGAGCYAVALSPRGKIIADLVILRAADRVITETTREAATGWLATIRKYVNPRIAKSTDDSAAIDVIELVGDGAEEIIRTAAGIAPHTAPFSHYDAGISGSAVHIARIPLYQVEAFRLTVPAGNAGLVSQVLGSAGAHEGTMRDLEVRRVEAGWPRWGRDMDESNLSQEANMDSLDAISFTKGCYTGQEFVARLHFRGHVNRYLRGVRLERDVPSGTPLVREDGSSVGDVRTVVDSPRHGHIALAMVRREVADDAVLRAVWNRGESVARVVALPFVP